MAIASCSGSPIVNQVLSWANCGSNIKHANIWEPLSFASLILKSCTSILLSSNLDCITLIAGGSWEQAAEKIQKVTEGLAAARETSVDAAVVVAVLSEQGEIFVWKEQGPKWLRMRSYIFHFTTELLWRQFCWTPQHTCFYTNTKPQVAVTCFNTLMCLENPIDKIQLSSSHQPF